MKRLSGVFRFKGRRWAAWAVVAVLAGTVTTAAAQDSSPTTSAPSQGQAAYATTLQYVIRFFPRVMTWWYARVALQNRFITPIAPDNGLLTSQSRLINAFNVDTVYAGTGNVDVSAQPVILTIPKPVGTFSIATLDGFGEFFNTGIPTDRGGTYALTLASWHGTLPPGVTRVNMPVPVSIWAIRADRYSRAANGVDYVNTVKPHQNFVSSIRVAPLSDYLRNPSGAGRTIPTPQALISTSTTQIADQVLSEPQTYLNLVQQSVAWRDLAGGLATPLSASDLALSAAFNAVYAQAKAGVEAQNYGEMNQINKAAQDAYATIQSHFFQHYLPGTFWINFNDIGAWGTRYLDRDATSAHIFLGNTAQTARYWDAYDDSNGMRLDTDNFPVYTMTFKKGAFPESRRFWSVTVYVGTDIHVTPGPSNNGQRNVAEYTPGLFHNPNGSVTIFFGPNPPRIKALRPNWVFVPPHTPFSTVIRVYGPTGNTACPSQSDCKIFVPPPIKPFGVLGPLPTQ